MEERGRETQQRIDRQASLTFEPAVDRLSGHRRRIWAD
jgi:hypothetical protein